MRWSMRAHLSTKIPSDGPLAQRIVTSARHHFLGHGFRHVTMDDLADELGMSKKTLYTAFPSKNDLLEAVLSEKLRAVDHDLREITADSSSDVLVALRRLLACMQHHTEEIKPAFVR